MIIMMKDKSVIILFQYKCSSHLAKFQLFDDKNEDTLIIKSNTLTLHMVKALRFIPVALDI